MDALVARLVVLKKKVLFPHCTLAVTIGAREVTHVPAAGDRLLACPVRSLVDVVLARGRIATLAEVMEVGESDGSVSLQLKGLSRVRILRVGKDRSAEFRVVDATGADLPDLKDTLRKKSQELIFLINVDESDKLIALLNYLVDFHQLSDFVANYFILDFKQRYRLFTETDPAARGRRLITVLDRLIDQMRKRREREEA